MTAMSVGGALRAAILALSGPDARREAELLLGKVTGLGRAGLIAYSERALTEQEQRDWASLLDRRRSGEPIAYLLGQREFFGLALSVTSDVLIPRPETELLVELALARLPFDHAARVLDLGTGSGAIALAIASHRTDVDVLATDLSPAALAVAEGNAARLGTTRVRFASGHWFDAVAPGLRFDLILSNPPYIAGGDPHLDRGDLRFEPGIALTPGGDGLDAYRQITRAAGRFLLPGGWLMFEHGYDQGAPVRALLEGSGFTGVATHRDLEARERVTMGSWPG